MHEQQQHRQHRWRNQQHTDTHLAYMLVIFCRLDQRNLGDRRCALHALKRTLIDEAKARGEKPTPATVDKQIAGIERSEAALRAIESVEATGGTAHYFSLDLRDADAVQAVVDDVRNRYGKIDVLLHAGGMLIDRTLPNKEPSQFALVYDVKADGFFNLLKAATGMPIGATVVFSSVAGRFGNAAQSNYSAANDLLCKISSSMKAWRPQTRGIALDWTAWGSIGMATRGSVPKIMEMLGIDMLPPEVGVPTIRRELTYSGFKGEIVVGRRLGALMSEQDVTGGLDTDKVKALLASRERPLPMIGAVKAARLYGGLEVETTLDPQIQPFLFDHQIDGTPVLPGVMGTESFAELATLLFPGYRVAGKTGTGEIATPLGYTNSATNTSFVGWGPAEDPKFLVYIWLEKPEISIWGSEVAAPVFSDLVEDLVVLMNIPPDNVRLSLRYDGRNIAGLE